MRCASLKFMENSQFLPKNDLRFVMKLFDLLLFENTYMYMDIGAN